MGTDIGKIERTTVAALPRIVRTGEGLRDALFDVLDGLRNRTITANEAIATAKVACQIVNTVKAEIEYQTHINAIRASGSEAPGVGTLRLGAPVDAVA